MPDISSELVNRYIEGAKVFAESKTEKLAVELATNLNAPWTDARRRRNPHEEPKRVSKAEKELKSWEDSILEEIHAVLCTRSNRFKKELAVLKHSAEIIVLYIASNVANRLGVNAVVVAAPVAAFLRLVFGMGISIFCKRFEAGML